MKHKPPWCDPIKKARTLVEVKHGPISGNDIGKAIGLAKSTYHALEEGRRSVTKPPPLRTLKSLFQFYKGFPESQHEIGRAIKLCHPDRQRPLSLLEVLAEKDMDTFIDTVNYQTDLALADSYKGNPREAFVTAKNVWEAVQKTQTAESQRRNMDPSVGVWAAIVLNRTALPRGEFEASIRPLELARAWWGDQVGTPLLCRLDYAVLFNLRCRLGLRGVELASAYKSFADKIHALAQTSPEPEHPLFSWTHFSAKRTQLSAVATYLEPRNEDSLNQWMSANKGWLRIKGKYNRSRNNTRLRIDASVGDARDSLDEINSILQSGCRVEDVLYHEHSLIIALARLGQFDEAVERSKQLILRSREAGFALRAQEVEWRLGRIVQLSNLSNGI